MKHYQLLPLYLFLVLFQSGPTYAGPIFLEFSGTLNFIQSELNSDFSLGDTVTGSYRYDTFNPFDVFPENDEIARYHVLTGFTVNVANHSWTSIDDGYIQVRDRLPTSPFPLEERYSVVQQVFSADSSSTRDDLSLVSVYTDAITGMNELDGIGLPDFVPFTASDYMVRFSFNSAFNGRLQMDAELDSISLVSEPSAISIFIVGIITLVLSRRRNHIHTGFNLILSSKL